VVIGAGIGGLTTAAVLAKAGMDVRVLEAHIYPGGCAGTFYHKKYRFDAGATLAGGFYPGGPMDLVARSVGIDQWPVRAGEPAMVVHLPDGTTVRRWGDERRWEERRAAFGPEADHFWHWQERTADLLWDLALRLPPWPPQTPREMKDLTLAGSAWLLSNVPQRVRPALAADFVRPVSAHLSGLSENLRIFTDAQLLIASQATSPRTNALYGASALDLPRRGVVHAEGGIGAIAERLAQTVQEQGGSIQYRKEVTRITPGVDGAYQVETKRGDSYAADIVVANLTPWNIARVLEGPLPKPLRNLPEQPSSGGGAFMLYLGVDGNSVPADLPLHHQVIVREPMGEGNTLFLSLSPEWDATRAPAGRRALTISTHTQLDPWWTLLKYDPRRYEARKEFYTKRLLQSAERVLPGISGAVDVVQPGTPVTFQRFTRREWGWVGGFPQTDLFRSWGPRLAPALWMVGDTIFPGQSTAAVALGGLRVANAILTEHGRATRSAERGMVLPADVGAD
jgi:C-3',4' desaturase CrtD